MSGDLQARKRKEKKRRKEDEGSPLQRTIPPVLLSHNSHNNHTQSDDVNIHVHKEGGLGGGICAKLVFFVLFSALAVLIGLIITEHRGLTDVDVVDTNSKFSQLFEGWTDSGIDQHDDHEELDDSLIDEHNDDETEADTSEPEVDNDEHEDEGHSEEVDDHDEEERSIYEDEDADEPYEDDTAEREDNDTGEDEDNATAEDDDNDIAADDDNGTAEEEENDEEKDVERDENEDEAYESPEEISKEIYRYSSPEKYKSKEDEDDNESEEKEDDESIGNDDIEETNEDKSVEEEYISEEKKHGDEDNEEQNEVDDYNTLQYDEDEDDDTDDKDNSKEERKDRMYESEENDEDPEKNASEETENDNDEPDHEEVIVRKVREEISKEDEEKTDEGEINESHDEQINSEAIISQREPDDDVQESAGMAVKVGVGVALFVVAHIVLCRKWRSAPEDKPTPSEDTKEATPDKGRRNTIIVPPTFQEVEKDIEHEEEELSEEEEMSEQEDLEPRTMKERYAELRSTYSRKLNPDGESISPAMNYDDDIEYEEEIDEELSEEEEDEDEDDMDEDDDDDEYEDEENEKLLERLDAKYGKLSGDIMPRSSPKPDNTVNEPSISYANRNITNQEDYKIRKELDDAQDTIRNNPAYAMKLFDKILEKFPLSPRGLYGRAMALNEIADQKRSNEILYKAIEVYTKLLKTPNVPDDLYKEAIERTIKVMRFVGRYKSVIEIHKLAIGRFPNEPKYYNDLAVTYLTINSIEAARSVLDTVLDKWPDDGFALVHRGFILKTTDNKLEEAVEYLRKGISTNQTGVIDGRFFFHLGDALERLGRHNEAMEVYEQGTKHKVFLSKYQRSLYNVARLSAKPFWRQTELPYADLFRYLKQNWKKIRDEGLAALDKKGYFKDESENLRDTGEWKQLELFARGHKNDRNCGKAPITCGIIDKVAEARGCKRGQTKFSVMHPGTHVWPHCGPTNCRLRVHLGLKVPPNTFLRVAEEIRSWKEGEIIIFDDSFEHEVWHNGTEFRLVLIVDIWHPELTASEKRNLSPI